MIVSIIAAVSENGVIGKGNTLPWQLPAELQYFRSVTSGKPVVMGRKTYDSIGRLLPKRHNIIVTHNADLMIPGADTAGSLDAAIDLGKKDKAEELFVIGGESLYASAIDRADKMYLTRVHTNIEGGEAFFPAFDEHQWKLVSSERHNADAENAVAFTTMVYERNR